MKDSFSRTLELVCKATLMEEEAAVPFLADRLEDEPENRGWLFLMLAWLRPDEARKQYQHYSAFGLSRESISHRIEALLEAQELHKKDKEALAAFRILGALLPADSPETERFEATCQYLGALDSLESLLADMGWQCYPDIPLVFRLCKEYPAEVDRKFASSNTIFWQRLFWVARLLLLTHAETLENSAEVARLIRQHPLRGTELFQYIELFAITEALDYLERSEPHLLAGLLPHLLPCCGSFGGDSRILLIVRLFSIIAPEAVDGKELKGLIYLGLEDETKREQLGRWDRRISTIVPGLNSDEESAQCLAAEALKGLQRMLTGVSL